MMVGVTWLIGSSDDWGDTCLDVFEYTSAMVMGREKNALGACMSAY